MKIQFLGTGGGKSIASRGSPAIYVKTNEVAILLDCGPHTVHQALKSQIPLDQISHIIFTHLHFDHCLGLPALLLNIWLMNPQALPPLHIPPQSRRTLDSILTTLPINFRSKLDLKIFEDPLNTDIELTKGVRFHSTEALHGKPKTYEVARLIRIATPEAKFVYTGDTAPTPNIVKIAQDTDLLIHEATHPDSERSLAHQLGHSTPTDAAFHAKEANTKRLFLTHISTSELEKKFLLNARNIFPNTEIAEDFQVVSI